MRSGFGKARAGNSIKYSWLYNLLLIALAGYLGMSLLPGWGKDRPASLPVNDAGPQKAAIQKPAPAKAYNAYRAIVERNLFASAKEEKTPVRREPPPEEVPLAKRSVGIKLVGTVVTGESEKNMAIIDNQRTGKQDVYREGERIERILIKRIVRNNVIIAMGTEERRLTMALEDGGNNTAVAGRSPGNREPAGRLRIASAQRRGAALSWKPAETPTRQEKN